MATKRVVVAGATGLIGKALCRELLARGDEVVVFSRDLAGARAQVPGATDYVAWTPAESGPWAARIDGASAVVNLAGASLAGKRWTEGYKRAIRKTRVVGTRGLVRAMVAAEVKPQVFVSGSAIGYYGARGDTPLDEESPAGGGFLAGVVREWEESAWPAREAGIRTVVVRTGVVLDAREGALPQLKLPFQFCAGGPILPGTQWVSWIHIADEVGIILLALEDERAAGAINAAAPTPQRNHVFSRTLGRVMGRPSWAPVPGFALKLIVGEFAEALITGQRVIPQKAQELGYRFKFETSEAALRDLLG